MMLLHNSKMQILIKKKRLRVIYNKQPAADTGGVTRHFFTQLLHQVSVEFFHGDDYKIPIYNSPVVASGMMTLILKNNSSQHSSRRSRLDDVQPPGVSLFSNGGCRQLMTAP